MKTKKLSVILLVLVYLLVNVLPVFAAAPRFGIDDKNTRQIKDSFAEMEFPFHEAWVTDLQGKVMSQPIVVNDYIYVQAGTDLVKVKLEDGKIVGRITVSDHELPSGSSPTYAETTHNPRIYQATRDHLLWSVDVNTFKLAWEKPFIISTDKMDYNVKNRYRITSSPLVYIKDNKTFIAIGSGNGDKTGKPIQYPDNGFFIIHDYGLEGRAVFDTRMEEGEVTGSPAMHNGMIIGTVNTQDKESYLIRYLLDKDKFASLQCKIDAGVPGSPAIEDKYIYVADRTSTIYKYKNTSEKDITEEWKNPEKPGDPDAGRALNSYNLMSPTIGNKYIYLPLQHYNSYGISGPGAIIAVDKETGYTHKICPFSSQTAYNPLFPQSHPTNNAMLKSNLLYWKPSPASEQDYLFVFDSKGSAWVLDGQTLEPVKWFYDKKTEEAVTNAQLFEVVDATAPEIVISDSYLIVVDGAGFMHTYKAERPINFKAHELKPAIDKEYKAGDELELNFIIQNTSNKDYHDIPLTLTTPDEKILDCGQIALTAGETKTIKLPHKLKVPRLGNTYKATINPEGHMIEILEEIKPRLDNTAILELNKRVNDVEIVSLTVPKETAAEKAVQIKTKIRNNSTKEVKDILVQWRADKKIIREETINLAKGESKNLAFSWLAPAEAAIVNISAIADPNYILDEENYGNNFMNKYIWVNKFTPRSCKDKLEEASWKVTYWVLASENPERWEPRTVTYFEKISAEITVNTKQGIPTNPKNPKKSDRESRGSWEIIPYAEELSKKLHKKVDPNEITRAGYGIELTVETNYWNDWEEKIPSGASAIGGTFNGPTLVALEIYDTTGYPIKEIRLEELPDSSKGKGKATWTLPYLPPYKFHTGEVVHERKHYTSPETKDGNYRLVIRVEYVGRNGLYTCLEKNVIIWGSMYDDIITVPLPQGYKP